MFATKHIFFCVRSADKYLDAGSARQDGSISFTSPKEMDERKGDPTALRNPASQALSKVPPNSRGANVAPLKQAAP